VFYQVFFFEFVNWDDQVQVVNNSHIKELSWSSLKTFFTSVYAGMYQPLTTLMFAFEYQIFQSIDASSFHVVSLILHLINTILVFILMLRLGLNRLQAFFIAMIFGIHPIQVEAVCWISARSTLLFSLFYISALIAYSRFAENRHPKRIIHTFLFFLAAVLSKPSAASFFLFLPVLEYWYYPKLTYRTILRMCLFAFPGLFFLAVSYFTRSDAGIVSDSLDFSVIENFSFALWSVVLYFINVIFPIQQNLYILYPEFQWYMHIIPLIAAAIGVLTFLKLKKYRRIIFLSAAFFLIPLSVHLKFIPFGEQFMADRYLYLSMIGVFFIPFYFLFDKEHLLKGKALVYRLILPLLLIAAFSVLSMKRSAVWSDSVNLWTHVIQQTPSHKLGYYNRGFAYRDKGRLHDAVADFTKVINLNPAYVDAYLARGAVYSGMKNYLKAIDDFSFVIKMNPELHFAYFNRGNAFFQLEDFSSALQDYKAFVIKEPLHESARLNIILSMIYLDYPKNELYEELCYFIDDFPDNDEAYYFRGIILMEGEPEMACADLRKAADLGNQEARQLVMAMCF
jgi:protein O-mannosyl-transferase